MSKSDGQILDFEKICRLCLVEKRSMSAIFSKKKSDKKVPLPVRIMSCASLELYEGDGLPSSICSKCLLSVNQSYAFREQCEQADTTLRQYAAQRMNETSEDISTKITSSGYNSKVSIVKSDEWNQSKREDLNVESFVANEKYSNDSDDDDDDGGSGGGGDDIESPERLDSISEKKVTSSEDIFNILKTVSGMKMSKSVGDKDLFEKLLKNKEISLIRKKSEEYVVTDVNEKWFIIKKLTECKKQQSTAQSEEDGDGDGDGDGGRDGRVGKIQSENKTTMLKCLESMLRKPKKLKNDSLVYCKPCNLFMKKSSLSGHNRFVHKKIKKFLCQTCGYATHTGTILRQHIQAVHVGYTFECGKCMKKFNLLKRLRKHEEIHHSKVSKVPDRKLICHCCGLSFLRPSYLKTHLLTHTEETPHGCQFCERKFKFRWAKVQHERLHTGDKPYKCQYCQEVFTQNKVRKNHEAKVHGCSNGSSSSSSRSGGSG